MAVWGQQLSIVGRSTSYASSGSPTVTWAQVSAPIGMIQPSRRTLGTDDRVEIGIKAVEYNDVFIPSGTTVVPSNRVRPFGWATGDDEYEVIEVNDFSPSHIELRTVKTRGHAS